MDSNFFDFVLEMKGYGELWRSWIKGFLQSMNFPFILNGKPRGRLDRLRQGGLDRGDPLSPFLFTLVVDRLSRLLVRVDRCNLVEEFVVTREGFGVTLANDTIFCFLGDDAKFGS